jgi:hypothetical protein
VNEEISECGELAVTKWRRQEVAGSQNRAMTGRAPNRVKHITPAKNLTPPARLRFKGLEEANKSR